MAQRKKAAQAGSGDWSPRSIVPDFCREIGIPESEIPALMARCEGIGSPARVRRIIHERAGELGIFVTSEDLPAVRPEIVAAVVAKIDQMPTSDLEGKLDSWLATLAGGTSDLGESQSDPTESAVGKKGVAPRDAMFFAWYHADGKETCHRPARIRDKWNGLPVLERKATCPDSHGTVTVATVTQAIKRHRQRAENRK